MKRKKLNKNIIHKTLSRLEMRDIIAGGSGSPGGGGGGAGGCSGNWTISPACSGYDGFNPNAIVCYDGPRTVLVCSPAGGTNPQTACCG